MHVIARCTVRIYATHFPVIMGMIDLNSELTLFFDASCQSFDSTLKKVNVLLQSNIFDRHFVKAQTRKKRVGMEYETT